MLKAFILISVLMLFGGAGGCQVNRSGGARNIINRDAAVKRAKDWEEKRHDDILKQSEIPIYGFNVIREYPHDETAFTEGLVMNEGLLYESAGLWGQSKLTATDLSAGREERRRDLAPLYFGEGIAVLGDQLFQLTYHSCIGFVYRKQNFQLVRTFNFPHQGWGLTTDGEQLIMSNGSASLIFMDPDTMETTGYVVAMDQLGPVGSLNELEYVDGDVYANICKTNIIAIISIETGKVTGWIDMNGLKPDPAIFKDPFFLNGIAYDAATGHFFVTGKCWPKIYEIELILRQ